MAVGYAIDRAVYWRAALQRRGAIPDVQREAQGLAVEALRKDDGVWNALREVFLKERGGAYALGDRSLGVALDCDYARALCANEKSDNRKRRGVWCVRY